MDLSRRPSMAVPPRPHRPLEMWLWLLTPLLLSPSLSQLTAGAADNHDERLAGEMRMPLPWMHDAVQLQAERPSKFDHLKSWTMKNYADKQSGKVKRSRMWAPPLSAELRAKRWTIFQRFFGGSGPSLHGATRRRLGSEFIGKRSGSAMPREKTRE